MYSAIHFHIRNKFSFTLACCGRQIFTYDSLTFKNRASYIWDGRTATHQMLHFIYFFNKNKY
jgi:hypothetical protein